MNQCERPENAPRASRNGSVHVLSFQIVVIAGPFLSGYDTSWITEGEPAGQKGDMERMKFREMVERLEDIDTIAVRRLVMQKPAHPSVHAGHPAPFGGETRVSSLVPATMQLGLGANRDKGAQ